MIIHNVGYNHCHDVDFLIERPQGSGDYLLLLLKTDSIFTIDGIETLVPKNTFFLYPKGVPQYYRCVPKCTFSNDWIHFDFEGDEEQHFSEYHVPYLTPITMQDLFFLSYCVKSIANENYSDHKNKKANIFCFMSLIFSKVDEQLSQPNQVVRNASFEMLSTIRNKIYSKPYEQRTIPVAAHEVRMSESAFQHLYKKQFGISFMQDLIKARIEYAELLLTSTDMTVAEVSKQCGYSSYAHFIRQFKNRTFLSPTEYRLQKRQQILQE